MILTKISDIKNLLNEYNTKPEKYLGQHFILSKNALTKMIETAGIKKNETAVEIGPGLGALTEELAKTDADIIAIEKDPLMVKILKETMAVYKNVKIIQADARKFPGLIFDLYTKQEAIHMLDRYKIVANLPYNVATFLIRHWLESNNPPESMVLMIQKEVAQRITAKPPHSNILGISIGFYADAEIIGYVKKEYFWPKPKVDAAIIKIIPKNKIPSISREKFFKILKAGFSQPRKQLAGNLSRNLKISKEKIITIFKYLNIPDQARAENLSLKQWLLLANNF